MGSGAGTGAVAHPFLDPQECGRDDFGGIPSPVLSWETWKGRIMAENDAGVLAHPLEDPEATLNAVSMGRAAKRWENLRKEPGIGEPIYRAYAAVSAVVAFDYMREIGYTGRDVRILDNGLLGFLLSYPHHRWYVPWLRSIPDSMDESDGHHECRVVEDMLCALLFRHENMETERIPAPVEDLPGIQYPYCEEMDEAMESIIAAEQLIRTDGFHSEIMIDPRNHGNPAGYRIFNDLRAVVCALLQGMPESGKSAGIAAATGGWWSQELEDAVDGLGGAEAAKREGLLGVFGNPKEGVRARGDCDNIGALITAAMRLRAHWEGKPPSVREIRDALYADSHNDYSDLDLDDEHRLYAPDPDDTEELNAAARRMTICAATDSLLSEAWRILYETEILKRTRAEEMPEFSTLYMGRRTGSGGYGFCEWDDRNVSAKVPIRKVPGMVRKAVKGMLCEHLPAEFAAETLFHEIGGRGVWQAALWWETGQES